MLIRYVILVALLAVLLAACGADTTPSAATAPAGATSQPAAGSAATSQPAGPTAPQEANPTAAGTTAPTDAPRATSAPADPSAAAATAAPAASVVTSVDGKVALKLVNGDVRQPVFVTNAGDGSRRLFVVEKGGTIAILSNGQRAQQPFLDITPLVQSSGSEQGLLGLAFHPDYKNNGRFFVYYTARNGDNTLARYQVSSDPNRADAATGVVLFAQADPAPNHNGGMLAFGPDKYLYVGLGDGGAAGDPWGNGQNRNALLGKLLRLDVDKGDPYGIPADNPWPSGGDARPEVWAYGLRNPWRFSFDRATGDLYIADVGQNQYEEIDFQPAGTPGGRNYGWNTREGLHCYRGETCASDGMTDPVAEYSHDLGCSITGGYVYRGAAIAALQGAYIYGDYCSGRIWTLQQGTPNSWTQHDLMKTPYGFSSFGEDEAGELYLTDIGGNALYQFVANR
jgi:glucose/arabinose dehydrogenase